MFEALLCTNLDALTHTADELETSNAPDEALVSWLREWLTFAQSYRGVVALMAAAHTNPDSALYAACAAVHSASARLLIRAQADGKARADMNGDDLFALMTALGCAVDQPSSRRGPITSFTSSRAQSLQNRRASISRKQRN